MKHIDHQVLQELRAQLAAREAQLGAEIAAVRQAEGEVGASDLDPGQMDYDAALALANLARDQREIDQVRAALGRMDRGTYGRCLSCGAGIPAPRLHAEPAAEYCRVCQERAESE